MMIWVENFDLRVDYRKGVGELIEDIIVSECKRGWRGTLQRSDDLILFVRQLHLGFRRQIEGGAEIEGIERGNLLSLRTVERGPTTSMSSFCIGTITELQPQHHPMENVFSVQSTYSYGSKGGANEPQLLSSDTPLDLQLHSRRTSQTPQNTSAFATSRDFSSVHTESGGHYDTISDPTKLSLLRENNWAHYGNTTDEFAVGIEPNVLYPSGGFRSLPQ
jgi:hypothetical protein